MPKRDNNCKKMKLIVSCVWSKKVIIITKLYFLAHNVMKNVDDFELNFVKVVHFPSCATEWLFETSCQKKNWESKKTLFIVEFAISSKFLWYAQNLVKPFYLIFIADLSVFSSQFSLSVRLASRLVARLKKLEKNVRGNTFLQKKNNLASWLTFSPNYFFQSKMCANHSVFYGANKHAMWT